MQVDVWSDVVCPWCYIGKHRFDDAAREAGVHLDVRYRAFQLDPTAPPGVATPLPEAYAAKFGGADRARHVMDKVTAAAAEEGLEFHLDRAVRANTRLAHRLIWWAGTPDSGLDQSATVDALMAAYFTDGLDVGDPDVLVRVATDLGADADAVAAFLDSDEGAAEVDDDLGTAAEEGITAVPTFVVERTWAIPGAQDRAVFVKVMRKLAAKCAG